MGGSVGPGAAGVGLVIGCSAHAREPAGGTDIALLCDMIIAADDALIGFPPARDLGALPKNMWIYNVGPQWAKRLTLTGDTISGVAAAVIVFVIEALRKCAGRDRRAQPGFSLLPRCLAPVDIAFAACARRRPLATRRHHQQLRRSLTPSPDRRSG